MQIHLPKRHYKFSIVLHVLAWLGFLSLPVLFIDSKSVKSWEMFLHWEFWFFCFCFIVPYYLNSYLWTPYIIRQKRYVLYVVSVILIGAVFAFWLRPFERLMQLDKPQQKEVFERRPAPPPPSLKHKFPFPLPPKGNMQAPPQMRLGRIDIASVYIAVLVIILGSLFRMVEYWMQSQQKVQEVQHAWTKAELAFLKAQVHPHFLFNTLNNIYSLALTGNSSTAASIYKLSQLMRYYMDEREDEEVNLQEEIQAVQDFIGLQKLRIGANCTLTEKYHGLHIEKKIYPFILLPFVENAFKYGLRVAEPCYLDFYIQVTDNYCLMEVKNSIAADLPEQSGSGTGLKNTRKLLEHLYPDKFKLDIVQNGNDFFVKLLLYI